MHQKNTVQNSRIAHTFSLKLFWTVHKIAQNMNDVDNDFFPNSSDLNGDITTFPQEVWDYFKEKGSGDVVTPAFLKEISGSTTIPVEKHDIYVMGKEKTTGAGKKDNQPVFFTKLRIDSKSSERNTVQGLLGVRFLGGYGYMNNDSKSDLKVMRPTNIDKFVTQDSSQFRKRAVIHVNGHVLAMSRAEGFCRIPLMDDRVLAKFEKRSNAKKREAYARKKKGLNEWAHINRKAMQEENKKAILGMLVAYKKNLRDTEFFGEFMRDIVTIGLQLRDEFCSNANIETLLGDLGNLSTGHIKSNDKKRSRDNDEVEDLEVKKRRVLDKISQNLKLTALRNIPSSKIKW